MCVVWLLCCGVIIARCGVVMCKRICCMIFGGDDQGISIGYDRDGLGGERDWLVASK